MKTILIGADPELFAKSGDTYLSAHGMIPGDKKNPHRVKDGAVQVDGMALEFNIEPAATRQEFRTNIYSVLEQLRAMVPEVEVVADPVARFTEDYMATQCREALELGCDPDYNAWTGLRNRRPDVSLPIRTGSGHVHIGWTETEIDQAHIDMCEPFVRQLDFYLALVSLTFDSDTERRSMYGQAGAYRPKTYGLEYRVLSNKWLSDPTLVDWVYDSTVACFDSMFEGPPLFEKHGNIQPIINNSDIAAAKAIIEEENLPVPGGYYV